MFTMIQIQNFLAPSTQSSISLAKNIHTRKTFCNPSHNFVPVTLKFNSRSSTRKKMFQAALKEIIMQLFFFVAVAFKLLSYVLIVWLIPVRTNMMEFLFAQLNKMENAISGFIINIYLMALNWAIFCNFIRFYLLFARENLTLYFNCKCWL